jgi:iron(III) transport system ATP-binding protein
MPTSPMADPVALRCAGVVKRFGSTVAVDGLDLDVRRGAITALLGPSGCGKTTTLRLIAGLEDLDAGEIYLDGHLVARPSRAVPPEKRHVGMVFQDYALFPHLNVGDNIAFGLTGLPRRARAEATRRALQLVGMEALAHRLPAHLSGGQQQRVALARALAPRPTMVLLDEPFSNLDARLRVSVRDEVRRILRDAGTTAVFVTHDQEEALSLADEVAVMAAGRLDQLADPHTLYTQPRTSFVAEFVGEANLLAGRRLGMHSVDTVLGPLQSRDPVEADLVTAVLRPEALVLRRTADGPAQVLSVSYFGHDQLLHVRLTDGTVLRARRGPDRDLAAGDRVSVAVAGPVVCLDSADTPATAAALG